MNKRQFMMVGSSAILPFSFAARAEATESYLMVHLNRAARVSVDGAQLGSVEASHFTRYTVLPGQHFVSIEAINGDGKWEDRVHFPPGEQVLLEPKMAPTDPLAGVPGTVKIGGQTHKTATIRGREWLAENLKAQHPLSRPWQNDEANVERYGRYYFLSAARSLAPPGWRLPTKADWEALIATYPAPTRIADLGEGGRSGLNLPAAGDAYWTGTPLDKTYTWVVFYDPTHSRIYFDHYLSSDFNPSSTRYCRDL